MIKIIENVIPDAAQKEVESLFLGPQFSWFYYANTNYDQATTRADDTPQFCHGFMRGNKANSPHCAIPLGILNVFNITMRQIIRAKANLMVREPVSSINPKHTDDNQEHIVFIYYVNDSDGDTHIWQEDGSICKVSPKRGRGVFFAGHLQHASSPPIQHRNRMVINFNLLPSAIKL